MKTGFSFRQLEKVNELFRPNFSCAPPLFDEGGMEKVDRGRRAFVKQRAHLLDIRACRNLRVYITISKDRVRFRKLNRSGERLIPVLQTLLQLSFKFSRSDRFEDFGQKRVRGRSEQPSCYDRFEHNFQPTCTILDFTLNQKLILAFIRFSF